MSQPKCSCESFERLEGASVPAYTKAFLEPLDKTDAVRKNHFRCKVCGRLWEKHASEHEGGRASLVRSG
jgi:hypothetical protein